MKIERIEKVENCYSLSGHLIGVGGFDYIDTSSGVVRLECGEVGAVTSCGTRDLIRWMRTTDVKPIFLNCSPSLVTHFNLVTDILRHGAKVESVQFLYECPTCQETLNQVMHCGVDYFPGRHIGPLSLPACLTCGTTMEPEYDPDDFFYFTEFLEK